MNKTKIYLVTNCYGDPNKVYIGKEKFPKKGNIREYYHKKQFGENIISTYIDEINSIEKKDWKFLECFWIEQFRQWGFELQNKNIGGGGPSFLKQESKNKISKANKGNKFALGNKQTKKTREKISKALKGKSKPEGFGNLMREVRLGIPKPKGFKENLSKKLKGRKNTWNSRIIIQMDIDGNFIKEWENMTLAGNLTNSNPSSISKVCRGFLKSTNGFKWKFK